jgi:hypothetical protein
MVLNKIKIIRIVGNMNSNSKCTHKMLWVQLGDLDVDGRIILKWTLKSGIMSI